MSRYKVQVATGLFLGSGTANSMSITLVGSRGESDKTLLNRLGKNFAPGTVNKCKVYSNQDLGPINLIRLHKERYLFFPEDNWFCTFVLVTSPQGQIYYFPCYQWLEGFRTLELREGTGKLVIDDNSSPLLLKHPEEELKARRDAYRWKVYAPGSPRCLDVVTLEEMETNAKYSLAKFTSFLTRSAGGEGKVMGHNGLQITEGMGRWGDGGEEGEQWERLKEERSETEHSCLSPEYVTNHWQEDSFFGYQYLNGVHPVFIRKCTEIPANFPVTQEMVAGSLGTSTTLQEALKTGKIFIADYKILEGLQTNVINSQTQHVTASLCLFYQEPSQGDLLPIAIQLTQTPGPESPIFLPSDSEWDWMLAKMWVRNSDFHVHQVVSHLLYTHLLAEVFAMATLRQLPMCHPLYKVRGVIWPNSARTFGLHPLMERGMQSLTYTTLCLPSDIQARGVNSIPNYCYRDDGMKLWTAIESFVSGIVEYYYKNNDRVQNDTELQAWVAEIFAEAFLGRNSSGAPSSIQTTAELVRFLTMVIFTCSAQHAAVNSAQFDFGAWMPNTPSSMRKPPPTAKGTATLESILETLPEVNTTCNIMIVLWQLSAEPEDKRPLGSFLDSHFVEVAPKRLIKAFQERLAEISMEIKERNKTLRLVYTYMDPPVVENSISI
uniref:Uncharacterized protein n=1 Tax=Sphenodon punctatus TaxID=8508 RepID=A0A8D0HL59_SPHPU